MGNRKSHFQKKNKMLILYDIVSVGSVSKTWASLIYIAIQKNRKNGNSNVPLLLQYFRRILGLRALQSGKARYISIRRIC